MLDLLSFGLSFLTVIIFPIIAYIFRLNSRILKLEDKVHNNEFEDFKKTVNELKNEISHLNGYLKGKSII